MKSKRKLKMRLDQQNVSINLLTNDCEVDQGVASGCLPEVHPAPVLAGVAAPNIVDSKDGRERFRAELGSRSQPLFV